jgi:hypothetical protein
MNLWKFLLVRLSTINKVEYISFGIFASDLGTDIINIILKIFNH